MNVHYQSRWRLACSIALTGVFCLTQPPFCPATARGFNATTKANSIKTAKSISTDLQSAFYRGNLEQLVEHREELEQLLSNESDSAEQAQLHYYLGLARRHQALLTPRGERSVCFDHAIKHLETAIQLDSKTHVAPAHALAAHCYRSKVGLGQRDHETIEQAIMHRQQAFSLAPADPRVLALEAYAAIAIPEERGGDIGEGLSAGFEAVGRFLFSPSDPSDLGIAFNWHVIGIGFQKQGDLAQAIQAHSKALEHAPDWKAVQDLVDQLKKLRAEKETSSGR